MIYAVNKRTLEHRIVNDARDSNMLNEVIIQADADGWIECDGERRPIDANQEIQWKGSNGFVSGVIPANCVFWGENGADKITAYRPILNAEEKGMKQEWKPEAGSKAQTSSGECEILAVDFERGMVSVRWSDGELGTGRMDCVKPLPTDRDRWIEAACKEIEDRASQYNENIACSMAMRMTIEALYDAGLAKLPEKTK